MPRQLPTTSGSISRSLSSREKEEKLLFRCESDRPKELISLLMSFGFLGISHSNSKKSSQLISSASQNHSNRNSTSIGGHEGSLGQMTIWPNPNGLQIHQAPNLQSQASLDLPKELFSLYHTDTTKDGDEEAMDANCCCISWKPFKNALQLALSQNPSKLSLTYNLKDEILHIETECLFSSGSVLCTALLGGLVPPDDSDTPQLSQAFLSHPIVARILVPSALFVDVHELSSVSPITIQLTWKPPRENKSNSASILQATAVGPCCECTVQWQLSVDWPADPTFLTFRYPFLAWNQAMKPSLDNQAHETCISVNQQGILAIQHQLICHDNVAAFCDGLLLPLVEDEDDAEDDDYGSYEDERSFGTLKSNRTQEEYPHHSTPPNFAAPADKSNLSLQESSTPRQGQQEDDESGGNTSIFFGSLSMEHSATDTPATSQHRRRAQRKRMRQRQRQSLSDYASQNLSLQTSDGNDDGDDKDNDNDDDDDDEEEDRYCSSPEVVYGKL